MKRATSWLALSVGNPCEKSNLGARVPLSFAIGLINTFLSLRGYFHQYIHSNTASAKGTTRIQLRSLDYVLNTSPTEHMCAVCNDWSAQGIQAHWTFFVCAWAQQGNQRGHKFLSKLFRSGTVCLEEKHFDMSSQSWWSFNQIFLEPGSFLQSHSNSHVNHNPSRDKSSTERSVLSDTKTTRKKFLGIRWNHCNRCFM